MEELWIFRATRHGKTRQSMRSAAWGSYPHHRRGICPRCQRLMALGEIPQGRSSNFPTLGGCHCSGRRVPVAA